jgi:putative ABC transport system permease protein
MEINQKSMLATMVFRSLWNNLRITAWSLLTLTTAAALVTLFFTVSSEAGRKMNHDLRQMGANAVAHPSKGEKNDWVAFDNMAQAEGISLVRLSIRVLVVNDKAVPVVAADPKKLSLLTPYWAVAGTRSKTMGECLVGHRAAQMLGLKLNQEFSMGEAKARVVGFARTGDEDDQRIFVVPSPQDPAGFSYALMSVLGDETEIERLQQAARSLGIEIKPLRQILHGEQHVLDKINVLFAATMSSVFVLTLLGVSASMLARVVERRKEFALLQAIGAKHRAVVKFLLAESAAIGLIASVGGFVVGSILAAVVVQQIFHVAIQPRWMALIAAMGTTTVVSLLASGIACRRTLKFQPAATLRGE